MNTNVAPYQGFLIDDDEQASATAQRFSFAELQLEFSQPADLEDFAQTLFASVPAILIVDYRLDERPNGDGSRRRYKASALAQQLRDLSTERPEIDFPIVLHSAEQKLREGYFPERTAHDLFDDVIIKDGHKDTLEIRERLMGLVEGYTQLIADRAFSQHQLEIFGLRAEQQRFIDYQEIRAQLDTIAVPHILARFILKFMIRRNNVLLDLPNVLARAGITRAGETALIQALDGEGARYAGVFARGYPRWWRQAVDVLLETWLGAPAARLTADKRAQRLSAALSIEFEPARSTWSGSTQECYTHSCVICELPTHTAHSVALMERGNDVLAHRRRLCFDCLQKDKYQRDHYRIDALDERVAADIKEGVLDRPVP